MLSRLTAVDHAAAQDILRQVEINRARLGARGRQTPRDWLNLFERQAEACHQALHRERGGMVRERCIKLAAILLEAAIRAGDPDPDTCPSVD